jgi:hypothetical protein
MNEDEILNDLPKGIKNEILQHLLSEYKVEFFIFVAFYRMSEFFQKQRLDYTQIFCRGFILLLSVKANMFLRLVRLERKFISSSKEK